MRVRTGLAPLPSFSYASRSRDLIGVKSAVGTLIAIWRGMKILVTGRTLARGAGPSARFETARQCQAQVTTGQADLRDARALLAATEVPCLETGGITSGARCLSCTRLVSFFPGPDRRSITVRCLWTDDDRVTTVMVPPARLAALPRDASA